MSIHQFHPKAPHAMPAVTWHGRLESALSSEDIVGIARDFLAGFSPYEIAALPAPCKPPAKLVDADDVTAYAFELVRHDCEHDAASAELVHKLAAFFSDASIRLSQLMAQRDRDDDQSESRQSA